MATIKLNPLITDLRKKMGTNVFSKWKGTNYVRTHTKPKDRKSPGQMATRHSFGSLVNIWKGLGAPIHEAWRSAAAAVNMTGYNLFIAENFDAMKSDQGLRISAANGVEEVNGFSVSAGTQQGEIACAFQMAGLEGKAITVFTQEMGLNANPERTLASINRHEQENANSPITVRGLKPGKRYTVYAVLSDGPYAEGNSVSESVSAEILLP